MCLPTLSHLSLTSISDFPISSLTTCANLKHLSVKDLHTTAEHDEATLSLLHKPIQLQAFDIETKGSQTFRLLAARCPDGRPVLDFTGLEKISIGFGFDWRKVTGLTREIFKKAQQLIHICLIGHEMLHITFTGWYSLHFSLVVNIDDSNFRAMQFAQMVTPSLQTLKRVELNIVNIKGPNDDPLAGLCDELEDISEKNRLLSIEIQIDVETEQDCHTGAEWGRLEKVLLKSGWPMLEHVSLVIVLNSWRERRLDSPFEKALKNLSQTQFANLISSEKLDFQFSVKRRYLLWTRSLRS